MPDSVRKVPYCYVEIPDKPGEGARILSAFKEAGVNFLAFNGFPIADGEAQIDFVPEDLGAFGRVAKDLGVKFSEEKGAFLIQGKDRVGAGYDVLGKLSSKGINVIASQAVTSPSKEWGMILWVAPSEHAKAAQALGV